MLVEVSRDVIERLKADLAEARAQITAYMNELAKVYAENEALAARHEKALVEGATRLAERDEARAQIAASEQEHQDFRLQNDAEWRAKLDHLKAQIAAKDAEIAKWQKAFAAQSSKLQSVLHIPGVKETLNGQR